MLCSFRVHMMSLGSDDCKVSLQLDAMTYIFCWKSESSANLCLTNHLSSSSDDLLVIAS